jgi:hypothetical protein
LSAVLYLATFGRSTADSTITSARSEEQDPYARPVPLVAISRVPHVLRGRQEHRLGVALAVVQITPSNLIPEDPETPGDLVTTAPVGRVLKLLFRVVRQIGRRTDGTDVPALTAFALVGDPHKAVTPRRPKLRVLKEKRNRHVHVQRTRLVMLDDECVRESLSSPSSHDLGDEPFDFSMQPRLVPTPTVPVGGAST